MSRIAIITARGGSKRIPRKNIREFCGKPILAYSIEAALQSGLFDCVMVSTEDGEIAEIAKNYGAEVPFYRSVRNADDFATTAEVLLEVLEEYRCLGKEFQEVCCIYPTAPFVTAGVLREAAELLEEQGADSVIPVVRFGFPPQRGVITENGCLRYKWPEHRNSRSQDLEPLYHDAGQFYFLRAESFLRQKELVMEKTIPLERPDSQVQDIDTLEDWSIAELKFQLMSTGKGMEKEWRK